MATNGLINNNFLKLFLNHTIISSFFFPSLNSCFNNSNNYKCQSEYDKKAHDSIDGYKSLFVYYWVMGKRVSTIFFWKTGIQSITGNRNFLEAAII